MKHYVAGFLFDYDQSNVLLVHKNRPAWQKGMYNGIGGKVAKGEDHYHAMVREFQEETGLYYRGWNPLVTLQYSASQEKHRTGESALVSFWYGTQIANEFEDFEQPTDEEIVSMPIQVIKDWPIFGLQFTPNLPWIILLALDDSVTKPLWNGCDADVSSIAYLRGV